MSRSNFSNCKNPDAVVQCALRIDRASREPRRTRRQHILGGGWPVGDRAGLHLSPAVGRRKGKNKCLGWVMGGGGGGAVTPRPLTLRRQPNKIPEPVRPKAAANPIHTATGCPIRLLRIPSTTQHRHIQPSPSYQPQFNVRTTVWPTDRVPVFLCALFGWQNIIRIFQERSAGFDPTSLSRFGMSSPSYE